MRHVAYLIVVLTLPASLSWGQTVDNGELRDRIRALEQRVDRLEQASKPAPAATGYSQQISSWRALKRGMTKDQVRALLGEPQRVEMMGPLTIWEYPSDGSVWFTGKDLLDQIKEPRAR